MIDIKLLSKLSLHNNWKALSRILLIHDQFSRILLIKRLLIEFGIKWGQKISFLHSFRNMYGPYDPNRKIVGFASVSGFPTVSKEGGNDESVIKGAFSVTTSNETHLASVLAYQEAECPLSHL